MTDQGKVPDTTHFGFHDVSVEEKAERVRGVFDSVAPNYDLMNDLLTGGIHRRWKRAAVRVARLAQGHHVLDLAGGTGDLSVEFAKRVGPEGRVVLGDINVTMLEHARRRIDYDPCGDRIVLAQVDAEALPFADDTFDRVAIAFGLRNVTHQDRALRSMFRTLKPGGKLLILEFSRPLAPVRPAYDLFSFNVMPLLGRLVARDEASYRYLAESIRKHPDQETLLQMIREAGFERARYRNLSLGIVALHTAYKPR